MKRTSLFMSVALYSLVASADYQQQNCNQLEPGYMYTTDSSESYCYQATAVHNMTSHPLDINDTFTIQTTDTVYLDSDSFTIKPLANEHLIVTVSHDNIATVTSVFANAKNKRRKRSTTAWQLERLCGNSQSCRASFSISSEFPEDTPANDAWLEMQDYHRNYEQDNYQYDGFGSSDDQYFRDMYDENCNYRWCG